ncbi:ES1 protein homolog, mitochondrial [Myotis lucifugus]|uniref:ES1 protein homolog, mitochondrial n=1 Tax=Myotis lucifugus TaxID=59463 RepID=UPI000CCC8A07|nr:ES1 protein homolog, mitochondrial [Myotis lucifugus]
MPGEQGLGREQLLDLTLEKDQTGLLRSSETRCASSALRVPWEASLRCICLGWQRSARSLGVFVYIFPTCNAGRLDKCIPSSPELFLLPKGHSDSTGSGTDGVLVHLSRGGAEVQIFAPNVPQMHVIDHTKGQPSESETRNVLAESARIARGKITDLAQLSAANHDAAIFPGGFGAAKNLSTFAVDGKDCKVNKDVERVLKDFHKAGKPIGLCCIAPVLAAKVLPGVEVTVGHEQEEGGKWPYAGTAEAIKAMGAKHCVKGVTEAHVDQKNKVVTTPAFMCETALHHIHDGIGAMVTKVLELARK